MGDLLRLPKAELHVHLENTLRWSTQRALATANGVDIPDHLADGQYRFRGFSDLFDQNTLVRACLRGPDDFRLIALERHPLFRFHLGAAGRRQLQPRTLTE